VRTIGQQIMQWSRVSRRFGWGGPVLLVMVTTMAAVALFDFVHHHFRATYSPAFSYIIPLLLIGLAAGGVTVFALYLYRKLAEEAFEEVNARQRLSGELTNERMLMRSLMENTPDFIFFKDREGRFVRVSNAMARVMDVESPSDLIGLADQQNISNDNMTDFHNVDREVMETGVPVVAKEDHVVWKDGRSLWISTTTMPWRDRAGRIIGTLSIARDITKRKQTELALHHQFAFQRQLIDAMPVPIFHKDRQGIYQECNEAFARFLGVEREAVIGHTVHEISPPDLAARYHEQDQHLFKEGGTQRYEASVLHADGTRHEALFNKALVYDDQGHVTGLVGAILDLTDLREAQAALQVENQRREELEQIINKSPAIVFLWKALPGWPVEFVSESISQFGFTPQDFTGGGIPFSQIIHPEDISRVGEEVSSYSARQVNEFVQEYRIFNKRGEVRWIDDRTWIRRNASGGITHYQGIIMDITERKLAGERQHATMLGLRAVLEMTDSLMASENLDELYRRAVSFSRAQLGLERTAILMINGDHVEATYGTNLKGQTLREAGHGFPLDEKWRERMRPRRPGEKPWLVTSEPYFEWDGAGMVGFGRGWVALTPIPSHEGTLGFFSNDSAISGAPVDEVKQEIIAVFCALLGNMIVRKKTEAEQATLEAQQRDFMERTDRLNSLSMVAAGMAHEINNPLQGMVSHLHAVQRAVELDDRATKSLAMVERGIETIATLVRKLLILGRAHEQEDETVDCCEAIEFVAQLMASQFVASKVKLELDLQAPVIMAAMPRRHLTQILLNLFINARDAMPDGGVVRVVASEQAGQAVVAITDSGTGIPAHELPQIFKPFFTTKGAKGSGLGLSVADALVRSCLGVISAESQPGETTFTIKLPLATRSK
jgi:PAS domain S-box-containing protein